MILAGFASEYVKLDFESLQTEVTAASTALDEQRAANETLRVKLQLVREVAHTLDAQTRKPAPTATQDCVESAQPEREQLLALGQRLDAVVNR
jgi:F0F1-type ATP synthase membrane subunit b/b'